MSGPEIRTHGSIDRRLVGEPISVGEGRSIVRLTATAEMAADESGLVHGGFLFGLADYAAMLAINEPTVVLASAECRFLAPVVVGDELEAHAGRIAAEGRKRRIGVAVLNRGATVFEAELVAAVPKRHVLDRRRESGP
jgi:acyl-coenzyme A thioesterase PaaI-like protein